MRGSTQTSGMMVRVAGAVLLAAAVGAPAAAAATGPATPQVRVGSAPALPRGAQVTSALPSTKSLHLTVALQPRDPAALQAFASAVSDPSSPQFRNYLSVPAFAERFGATDAQVAAVQVALRAEGLDVGPATANNLMLPVTGTAKEVEQGLSVSLSQVKTSSGRTAYANAQAPAVPASVASLVQGVIGLDDLAPNQPQATRSPLVKRAKPADSSSQVVTGGPQPCGEAAAQQNAGYTPDQIATAYQFSPLYLAGDMGAGQTVAVFEQQPYQPSDIATYQACMGTAAAVSNVDVDGGPGPYTPGTSDDGEAALDIEEVVGLAPKASVLVYEGPGTANAPVDIISAIVTQNRAKVISSSWGVCEALTGGSVISAENTLLQEAAAQGQTFLVASGDSGSEQCSQVDQSNTSLSVLNPASQPFATGVGGTSMAPIGPPPTEYVWNEGPRANGGGGTGGGLSNQWPMPSYQSSAPNALGVVNSASSAAPCGATTFCREVPDIAADADVQSGYIVYVNGGGQNGGWTVIGGTSASAPVWAAFIALANSAPACRSVPIGFVNPLLYGIAGSAYLANFHDVTQGIPGGAANNDTLNGTGAYPVGPNYDMTTGLGTPIGQTLAASLCADASPVFTVGVTAPGAPASTLGVATSLQIGASDSGGAALSYSATGLPPGLSINPTTALISGVPTALGAYAVTVSASDRYTNAGSTAFTWTVVAPPPPKPVVQNPKTSHPSLTGVKKRRAHFSFTITASSKGKALHVIAITLPGGLSFNHSTKSLAKHLTIKSSLKKKIKYKLTLKKGVLTITLAKSSSKATLSFGYPAIKVSSGLATKVKRKKTKAVSIHIKTTDAAKSPGSVTLRTKVS